MMDKRISLALISLMIGTFAISMLIMPVEFRGGVYVRMKELDHNYRRQIEDLARQWGRETKSYNRDIKALQDSVSKLLNHTHDRHEKEKVIFKHSR